MGAVLAVSDRRPTVLTVRALGLGDLLTATPALRAIARRWPDHRHVLATPGRFEPLVAMIAGFDLVLDVDATASPAGLAALADTVVASPDVAVNLHGRGPESSRYLLDLQPSRLVAFRHADVPATRDGPAWHDEEHEVRRWCRLLRSAGAPADPADLLLYPRASCVIDAASTVVLHPGAAAGSRRWPEQRWVELAAALHHRGLVVVVTGGATERDRCRRICRAAGLPRAADRSGTTLPALTAIVAGAALVVVGDTGVAHLATALATPSVVLFGPESPRRWGPPEDGPHTVLWRGTHGDPRADGIDAGLASITTEEVLDAALARLPAVMGAP